MENPINNLNKVVRGNKRAHYDKTKLYEILDAGYICQIAYDYNGTSVIIPTLYGRRNDEILIHGASKSRMLQSILEKERATVSVWFMDALVIAKSIFHHSVNYRSANIFCAVSKVNDDDKVQSLKEITEHMLPGHWDSVRKPNEKELKATAVLSLKIDQFSIKVRDGGPIEEPEDLDTDYWHGIVPLERRYGEPINGDHLTDGAIVPNSIQSKIHTSFH
ncbi:MAG: pyridoxamine 5'-phosphate oxidase family protein [Flavobacteriales bacterium]|nr:pyridoxamine 5'-phosphate oxidase family protein [Flavobacteriales bacterium]